MLVFTRGLDGRRDCSALRNAEYWGAWVLLDSGTPDGGFSRPATSLTSRMHQEFRLPIVKGRLDPLTKKGYKVRSRHESGKLKFTIYK
jgi:hypothetical protein